MSVGEITAKGWQQGSVIKASDTVGIALMPTLTIGTEDILIVISQSCDVVQPSLEVEPFVEVLQATKSAKPDGQLTHGKHPRRVQFEIAGCLYEASCHDRARLAREALASISPSLVHSLDFRTVDMLANWITKRYTRPAFPDELNIRINACRSKLADVLKKHGGPIDQILLGYMPRGEAKPEESYKLLIKMVMTEDEYANEPKRAVAQHAVLPFEKLLNECRGIVVDDCDLTSESMVTLDDLRFAEPWDFEYLTYRASSAMEVRRK